MASGADRVFDKSRDIDQLVAYCIALSLRDAGRPAPLKAGIGGAVSAPFAAQARMLIAL